MERPEHAEKELRSALKIFEATLDDGHPYLVAARQGLATLLVSVGRAADALDVAEKAWADAQSDDVAGRTKADVADILARALWYTAKGEGPRARARDLARQAIVLYDAAGPVTREQRDRVRAWLDEREK
jgi:hypothetical protein